MHGGTIDDETLELLVKLYWGLRYRILLWEGLLCRKIRG